MESKKRPRGKCESDKHSHTNDADEMHSMKRMKRNTHTHTQK